MTVEAMGGQHQDLQRSASLQTTANARRRHSRANFAVLLKRKILAFGDKQPPTTRGCRPCQL